ncbi:hypothetical protein SAMN05660964_00429 [Thiothrix caldifontis]|jgi:hypothetical protein|uniref:Uncharacterized protein n=1 Tax=Thiothrix caldifontis TaxID=525918 RepID=A0A1H3WFK4_9GAMM|nr:hypothetical protein [Thiothrix caldifontis]SDZ85916.1 hypothetical protein SAMN05660964_00429 [Thiothrix caldifontis]
MSLYVLRFLLPPSKALAIATGLCALALASPASANRITLVATMNNQSVLSPAHWFIFNIGDQQQEPVAELPRHSGTVYLPAGKYRAEVKQNQRIKHTEFRVESNVDKTVTIALDE